MPLPLLVAIFSILILSFRVWAAFIQRLGRREPGIPYAPRRTVPWTGWDVLLILLAGAILQYAAAYQLAARSGVPIDHLDISQIILANMLANVGLFAVAAGWLVFRRARAQDLGWSSRTVPEDVLLGLQAFVAVVVPVYAIQLVLTLWFPSEHPLVTVLEKQPDVGTFLVCFASAVIVAPIVEEFLFRVILLGWLDSLETRWRRPPAEIGVGRIEQSGTQGGLAGVGEAQSIAAEVNGSRESSDSVPSRSSSGVGAIVASSLVFALMHWGHGPDPIPLFFLAAALGYVYHRRWRILPCVLVHTLLNASSLLLLWWEIIRRQ